MDESAKIRVKKVMQGGGTLKICRVPRGGISGLLNALSTTELSPSVHRSGNLNPEMSHLLFSLLPRFTEFTFRTRDHNCLPQSS